MIKNSAKLEKFNNKLIKNERISHKQAMALYDSMLKEATDLGVITSKNIMDGIEVDVRIARALNKLPGKLKH
ncbi:MAG: hypothetical protein A2297_07290 [Elusimicrobia bacterium RIFOXYB2_FULL_48_7]|nr:MAG: hypothetical protein A2297_07290 [Elusimicrobia bacterium RIFOXYB2_FULL_48_7]